MRTFEKGYSALFGVKPVPINKWTETKDILRQLRTPEVQAEYQTVIIDTADLAIEYCKEYICNKEQVTSIGDIPYGQGYGMYEKEYENFLLEIPKMGYGLVVISHDKDKTFTDENGIEYNKITTTLDKRAHKVTTRAVDVYAYARMIERDGQQYRKLFLRGTSRFEAGSRFKKIAPMIDFSYEALQKAIKNAVEEEAAELGLKANHEVKNLRAEKAVEYGTFAEEKDKFDELVSNFIEASLEKANLEDPNEKATLQRELGSMVVSIVEDELGKGKKVSEMVKEQVDILFLINNRIERELLT